MEHVRLPLLPRDYLVQVSTCFSPRPPGAAGAILAVHGGRGVQWISARAEGTGHWLKYELW